MAIDIFNDWLKEATQLTSWKRLIETENNNKHSFQQEGFRKLMLDNFNSFSEYNRLIATLNDEKFLDKLSNSESNAADLLKDELGFTDNALKDPLIIKTLMTFEKAMEYAVKRSRTGNPKIGNQSKSRADIFAETMSENLQKVRNEGHTTMRSIADRFNELGIKSARGYDWSHTTVNQLIKRRKALGLESEENDSGLDVS